MSAAAAAITFLIASSSVPGSHLVPALLMTLHVIAAGLCIDRARRPADLQRHVVRPGSPPRLWLAVAAGSIVLLASRVTGLLPALTQLGRDLASEQGWYDHRRPVQALALSVMAIAAATAVPALVRAMRRLTPALSRAIAAVIVLLGLLVVRAVSLHQVEHLLASSVGGMEFEHVIEIAAALMIIVAAPETSEPTHEMSPASCAG